jgi:CheY-like chemotaxis protein
MSGRVLVVGLDRKQFQKLEPILSRSQLEVDRVPKGESGVLLATTASFDLFVVHHPLPDMALGSFMNTVHEPGALNGATPILVLAHPTRLEEVRTLLPGGAKQALSSEEPARLLQEMATRLLGVAARVSVRVPVKLEVGLGEGPTRVACQSENLSADGLLIRSETLYPIGTKVQFECTLPGEFAPIRGDAEIVRHAVADVEKVHGIGLKVHAFKGDGGRRLKSFVAKTAKG